MAFYGGDAKDAWEVQDAMRLLVYVAIIAIILIALISLLCNERNNLTLYGFMCLAVIFCVPLAIISLLLFNNYQGYTFRDGVFYFPGGGIAAQSLKSYFSPGYYLQSFRRYCVNVEDIQYIHLEEKDKKLVVSGVFGTLNIKFVSRSNLVKLYSSLMSTTGAGLPVRNIN